MAERHRFRRIPTRQTRAIYHFIMQTRTIYDFITLHQFFSDVLSRLAFRFKVWKRYSICFCKSAAVISGLLFGRELIDVVLVRVLLTFLTDMWKTDNILIKSITIVYCQRGLQATLVILMAFISETRINRFKTIVCSSAIFIYGLVEFSVSSTGQVEFGPRHIIAVFCLAAGRPIVQPAKKFISDQLRAHEPKGGIDDNRVEARTQVWYLAAQLLTAAFVLLGTPVVFSAYIIGIAYVLFLCGSRFYHCKKQTNAGSPLTRIFYVVKSAFLKWRFTRPDSPSHQLVLQGVEDQLSRDIIKLIIMFPLWTTFIVFGLGLATADVLFPEQGDNMKSDVSVLQLLIMKSLSGSIISALYNFVVSKWVPNTKRKCCHLVRIWLGMLLSVVCFTFAWRVEKDRREVIIHHGLLYKPKDTIPMSSRRLAPQFCIYGVMERLAVDGLDDFFSEQVSAKSLDNYGSAFKEFFIGIGNFISVICVHASGTWFGQTLNLSRLDKYYMMIAIFCFINFCFCSYTLNLYRQSFKGEQEPRAEPDNPSLLAVPPLNINLEAIV